MIMVTSSKRMRALCPARPPCTTPGDECAPQTFVLDRCIIRETFFNGIRRQNTVRAQLLEIQHHDSLRQRHCRSKAKLPRPSGMPARLTATRRAAKRAAP